MIFVLFLMKKKKIVKTNELIKEMKKETVLLHVDVRVSSTAQVERKFFLIIASCSMRLKRFVPVSHRFRFLSIWSSAIREKKGFHHTRRPKKWRRRKNTTRRKVTWQEKFSGWYRKGILSAMCIISGKKRRKSSGNHLWKDIHMDLT